MAEIDMQELQIHASEILSNVKVKRTSYIVTLHGRPVAAIIPVDEVQAAAVDEVSAWDELVRLGQEIGQNWQAQQSGMGLLCDMRK